MTDAGDYQVVVSGDCGPVLSDVASVIVETIPEITDRTADVDACPGTTINLSVSLALVGPSMSQSSGVELVPVVMEEEVQP